MKRLKNSMKALITGIVSLVLVVGIVVGVILFNNGKDNKNIISNNIIANQKELDNFSNAINNQSSSDKLVNSFYQMTDVPYKNVTDSTNTLKYYGQKYFVTTNDDSGVDSFYIYTKQGTNYSLKNLTLKVSEGGFVNDDAKSYTINSFNEKYVVIVSKYDVPAESYYQNCIYKLVYFGNFDNPIEIFSFNTNNEGYIFDNITLKDDYFSFCVSKDINIETQEYKNDLYFYPLTETKIDLDNYQNNVIQNVEYDEEFGFQFFESSFYIKNKNVLYAVVFENNEFKIFEKTNSDGFEINVYEFLNNGFLIETIEKNGYYNINDLSVLIDIETNGYRTYGNYKYFVLTYDNDEFVEEEYKLTDGYAKLEVGDIVGNYISLCEQYIQENVLQDKFINVYLNSSFNKVIAFESSSKEEILYGKNNYFVTTSQIFKVVSSSKKENIFNFSMDDGGVYLVSSQIDRSIFIVKSGTACGIMDVYGNFIIDPAGDFFASICELTNDNYAIGYSGSYYLISLKDGSYSDIENFCDDENFKNLLDFGSDIYLTESNEVYTLKNVNGEVLCENIYSYNFVEINTGVLIEFFNEDKLVYIINFQSQSKFSFGTSSNDDSYVTEMNESVSTYWSDNVAYIYTGTEKNNGTKIGEMTVSHISQNGYDKTDKVVIVMNAGYCITNLTFRVNFWNVKSYQITTSNAQNPTSAALKDVNGDTNEYGWTRTLSYDSSNKIYITYYFYVSGSYSSDVEFEDNDYYMNGSGYGTFTHLAYFKYNEIFSANINSTYKSKVKMDLGIDKESNWYLPDSTSSSVTTDNPSPSSSKLYVMGGSVTSWNRSESASNDSTYTYNSETVSYNIGDAGAYVTLNTYGHFDLKYKTPILEKYYYARYTANTYYTYFDLDDGEWADDDDAAKIEDIKENGVKYGSTFCVPTPTKTGYTFNGWVISNCNYGYYDYPTTYTTELTFYNSNGSPVKFNAYSTSWVSTTWCGATSSLSKTLSIGAPSYTYTEYDGKSYTSECSKLYYLESSDNYYAQNYGYNLNRILYSYNNSRYRGDVYRKNWNTSWVYSDTRTWDLSIYKKSDTSGEWELVRENDTNIYCYFKNLRLDNENKNSKVTFTAQWKENDYNIQFEFATVSSSNNNNVTGYLYDSTISTYSSKTNIYEGSRSIRLSQSNSDFYFTFTDDNHKNSPLKYTGYNEFTLTGYGFTYSENLKISTLLSANKNFDWNWLLQTNAIGVYNSTYQFKKWLVRYKNSDKEDIVIDLNKYTTATIDELISRGGLEAGGTLTFVACFVPRSFNVYFEEEKVYGSEKDVENSDLRLDIVPAFYQWKYNEYFLPSTANISNVLGTSSTYHTDVTSGKDFTINVQILDSYNATTSTYYNLQKIEIKNFGYYDASSSSFKTTTLTISSANIITTSPTVSRKYIKIGGVNYTYYGDPYQGTYYNLLKVDTFSSNEVTIQFKNVFYAGKIEKITGTDTYTYNFTTETVTSTGTDGFTIRAFAESKMSTSDSLSIASASDGNGNYASFNVQEIAGVSMNGVVEGGSGSAGTLWFDGVRYIFRTTNSNDNNNNIMTFNDIFNAGNKYYIINRDKKIIYPTSSYTFFNVSGSDKLNLLYVVAQKLSGRSYVYAYYYTGSDSDSTSTVSDMMNVDSYDKNTETLFKQNYNNTQFVAIRPEQTTFDVATSTTASAANGYKSSSSSTFSQYYNLVSYLSAIKIGDTTFTISIDRPFSDNDNNTLSYYQISVKQGDKVINSITPFSKFINYLGYNYMPIQKFELIAGSKTYILYFAYRTTATSVVASPTPKPFTNGNFDTDFELMYFIYNTNNDTTGTIELTFGKFDNTITTTIDNNGDVFGSSSSSGVQTAEVFKNNSSSAETLSTVNSNNNKSQVAYTINPTDLTFIRISPKDGYLIKSIKVTYGSTILADLSLYWLGLGNPNADNTNEYSYVYSSQSNISYTDKLNYLQAYTTDSSQNTYGKQLCGFYAGYKTGGTLNTSSLTRYGFESIFLVFGGMCQDVNIEVTTVSYIEFDFKDESSNLGLNTSASKKTVGGTSVYKSLSAVANLTMLVYQDDKWIQLGTDTTSSSGTDYQSTYKYDASYIYNTSNELIRAVFLGKAYLFNGNSNDNTGVKILASGENYSSYFTQAYVYGNGENNDYPLSSNKEHSGRTALDGLLASNAPLTKSDKLTYVWLNVSNITGTSGVFRNVGSTGNYEFAKKYVLIMSTEKNLVTLTSNSYVYNDTITTEQDSSKAEIIELIKNSGYSNKVYYSNFSSSNSSSNLNISWRYDEKINGYQLDYVSGSYKKASSWFNETVLTNIDINYNWAYNSSEFVNKGNQKVNWQDINKTPTESSYVANNDGNTIYGYGLKYTYYEVPGYYLQYIDIITDKGLFTINVTEIKEDEDNRGNYLLKGTVATSLKIYYKIEYSYSTGSFDIYLYNDSSNLGSIDLISNNITVNFYSMAYTFKVEFDSNTDNDNADRKISTTASGETGYVTVTYDSFTTISRSLTMTGYTFVGWGSEKYYGGTSRYDSETNTWNSSSSWLDCSGYFASDKRDTLMGIASDPATKLNSYDFYIIEDGKFNFITDTGTQSTENYNFWSAYAEFFTYNIGHYKNINNNTDVLTWMHLDNLANVTVKLYAVWKANTYMLEFDFNDSESENKNGSTTASVSNTYNGQQYTNFLSTAKITLGSNDTCYAVSNEKTYYFYITFDTNNWFVVDGSTSSDKLKNALLAYQGGNTEFIDSNNLFNYVIDRYGYTWLGWTYEKSAKNAIEGGSISTSNVAFASKYAISTYLGGSFANKPIFGKKIPTGETKSLYDKFVTKQEVSCEFRYKGQATYAKDSSGNNVTSYVYFYDYNKGSTSSIITGTINNNNVNVYYSQDYLNNILSSQYGKHDNGYLAYFDTSVATTSYGVSINDQNEWSLSISRTGNTQNRYIKLYAYWEANKYYYIYDYCDGSTTNSLHTGNGSTTVQNAVAQVDLTRFDYFDPEINNSKGLSGSISTIVPNRVGYDFLGYSFFYYDAKSNNSIYDSTDTVNWGNSVYTRYDNVDYKYIINNNVVSSGYIVNGSIIVPMFTRDNLFGTSDNFAQYQETLGGGKDAGSNDSYYVYLFAIWKAQTFTANLSLNINKEELLGAYAENNSYALGFYDSLVKIPYSNYSKVVNSSNLKYDSSSQKLTYADIVANVQFVFTFDGLVQNAYTIIDGNVYYLKDLFAISAGYYFLGWLLNSGKENSILVANTLKSTFDNKGALSQESGGYSDIGVLNNGSWDAKNITFNYDFLNNLYRSNYKDVDKDDSSTYDFEDGNKKTITSINALSSSALSSTNFGYLEITGGEKYYFQVEYDIDALTGAKTNYRMFFWAYDQSKNGTKYYVVPYYEKVNSGSTSTNTMISFDDEFMYVESGGTLYPIQFDSAGNAYYVTGDWKSKHIINIKIAVFKEVKNKTSYAIGGDNISLLYYDNGSMKFSWTGSTETAQKCTFTAGSTRQFTLYAHWAKKTDLAITITNANNAAANGGNANSAYNDGLSGYYEINTTGKEVKSENQKNAVLELGYNYFDNLDIGIIPYYNGRFLSELSFAFYGIEEVQDNNKVTKSYLTTKYIITINFAWDSTNKIITISTISFVMVKNGETKSQTSGASLSAFNSSNLKTLTVTDIKNLSLLYLNGYSYSDQFDFLNVAKYAEYDGTDGSLVYGRRDVNKVSMSFKEIYSSIEISCKFSIQTYDVNFYYILDNEGDNLELVNGKTNVYNTGYSKDDFQTLIDTTKENYLPYISSEKTTSIQLATIQQNVALGNSSSTYNVPYGYFIYGKNYTSSLLGNRPVDDEDGKYVDQAYNGYEYIYANGYYTYGTTSEQLVKNGADSYYSQCSPLLGQNNLFPTKSIRLNLSFYNFKGWYSYSLDSSNNVMLTEYDKASEATYINKNITLYAYYYAQNKPTSIQFYTWDDATSSYKLYTGNKDEYTLNSNVTSSAFATENGNLVAKSGQTEYVDDDKIAKINTKLQYGVDASGFGQDGYTLTDFRDDASSGGTDINVLNTLLRTYWYYLEAYDALYIESGGSFVSYIYYDTSCGYFYYLNSSNSKVKVEISCSGQPTAEDVSYTYNLVGNSTKRELKVTTLYKYNIAGAKLYVKYIDSYYELTEIDDQGNATPEYTTTWLKSHRPRYYTEILGTRYYLLPQVKDSAAWANSETLYTSAGVHASLSHSIVSLDSYYIIQNEEYFEVKYQTSTDSSGSTYINPYTMPGRVQLVVDGTSRYYYLNYNDQTLYTSVSFIEKATFDHKVYCAVNDNFAINAINTDSKWTFSGTTINALPSPNNGFWYNNEQYGFIGYINASDDTLAALKEASDDTSEWVSGSGIYSIFSNYIDALFGSSKSETYIANLKIAVAARVSAYTISDMLSSLLIADSYTYSGTNIDYVTINIPCSFENIEFEDENGVLQTISLSVIVKQQFKLVSKQTTVEGNIYAVPIYSPYVMEFKQEAISTSGTTITIESNDMNVWHFETTSDTTHVYNKANGDMLNFVVLSKEQYLELYNNSSNIAEYLTYMLSNGKYIETMAEKEIAGSFKTDISYNFAGNEGDFYIFSFYYKTGIEGSSSNYVIRVSDNFVHVNADSSSISTEITDLSHYGTGN
jgi:hypothetical protein